MSSKTVMPKVATSSPSTVVVAGRVRVSPSLSVAWAISEKLMTRVFS